MGGWETRYWGKEWRSIPFLPWVHAKESLRRLFLENSFENNVLTGSNLFSIDITYSNPSEVRRGERGKEEKNGNRGIWVLEWLNEWNQWIEPVMKERSAGKLGWLTLALMVYKPRSTALECQEVRTRWKRTKWDKSRWNCEYLSTWDQMTMQMWFDVKCNYTKWDDILA